MNLYEIEKSINEFLESGFEKFIDTETGEFDEQNFNDELGNLELAKNEKIENIGLLIKNLTSDINDLKAEEGTLAGRRKTKENKINFLKNILSNILNYEKFETSKIVLSFRKSEQVQIADVDNLPKKFLTEKVSISPNKTEIKKAIKSGQKVQGAELITVQNLQIK